MRALKQLIGFQMPKNIDELIRESIKLRHPFQHFATVIISQGDIIKGISQSKPNNLILDNFGTWLAGFFRAPVQGATFSVSLKGDDGAANDVFIFGSSSAGALLFNYYTKIPGSTLKVGSGSTPAARGDYDIETALATSPEDTFFDSGTGSYAAGSISVGGAITSGGSGTINEVGIYGHWWEETGDVEDDHMLFHDILVSGEAFTPGQTITVAYTINL